MNASPQHGPSARAAVRRPVAQYRQIANILRQRITAGQYRPDLPPDRQLAEEFNTRRDAIRDALGLLSNEGLLEQRPRHPARVRETRPRERVTVRSDAATDVIITARMPTPSERAEWQIPAGVPVLVVGEAIYPSDRYRLVAK